MADAPRFCKQCGAPLAAGQVFCEQCGASAAPITAPPPPAAPGPSATEAPPRVSTPGPSVPPLMVGAVAAVVTLATVLYLGPRYLGGSAPLLGAPGTASPTAVTATPSPIVTPPPVVAGVTPPAPATPTTAPASPTRLSPTATRPTTASSPTPTRVPPTATRPTTAAPTRIPQPPALGSTVLNDPLTTTGAIRGSSCPLGLTTGEFAAEGYIIKIRGKCRDTQTSAAMNVRSNGLAVVDGEVRVQARVVSGADRGYYYLVGRVGPDRLTGYSASFNPSARRVSLFRWQTGDDTTLAQESEPTRLPFVDGWNTVALRFKGSSIWVLLNDTPVIRVDDATYDRGAIELGGGRSGNVNDTAESATVFRNLQVRALADGDPGRAPTYRAASFAPLPVARPTHSGEVGVIPRSIEDNLEASYDLRGDQQTLAIDQPPVAPLSRAESGQVGEGVLSQRAS